MLVHTFLTLYQQAITLRFYLSGKIWVFGLFQRLENHHSCYAEDLLPEVIHVTLSMIGLSFSPARIEVFCATPVPWNRLSTSRTTWITSLILVSWVRRKTTRSLPQQALWILQRLLDLILLSQQSCSDIEDGAEIQGAGQHRIIPRFYTCGRNRNLLTGCPLRNQHQPYMFRIHAKNRNSGTARNVDSTRRGALYEGYTRFFSTSGRLSEISF